MLMAMLPNQEPPINGLSADEEAAGFELLFDGKSLSNFRGYNSDDVPSGWSASEGELAFTPGLQGGDLSTVEAYKNFDLRVEFKISAGGNSGIKILVADDDAESSPLGPEYQIIDDDAFQSMEAGVEDVVNAAVRFADESPAPPPEALFSHVYKEDA
ncbi:MAG: DUF1080 domain-containing protein [Armatimonadetes bacterium]|nr:DUF1080 domain-containing protein [Armatimonadota bacterium]